MVDVLVCGHSSHIYFMGVFLFLRIRGRYRWGIHEQQSSVFSVLVLMYLSIRIQ